MKRTLYIIAVSAAVVLTSIASVTSCQSRSRLARDISGSWDSSPEMVANNASGQTTVSDNLTFTLGPNEKDGGIVTIMSTISSVVPRANDTLLTMPFESTVSATATISGTWKAIDDDEIAVVIDRNSLQIDVDPVDLETNMNPFNQTDASSTASLSDTMRSRFESQFRQIMLTHYGDYKHICDIDFKSHGSLMKIEIADRDYILNRVS